MHAYDGIPPAVVVMDLCGAEDVVQFKPHHGKLALLWGVTQSLSILRLPAKPAHVAF